MREDDGVEGGHDAWDEGVDLGLVGGGEVERGEGVEGFDGVGDVAGVHDVSAVGELCSGDGVWFSGFVWGDSVMEM